MKTAEENNIRSESRRIEMNDTVEDDPDVLWDINLPDINLEIEHAVNNGCFTCNIMDAFTQRKDIDEKVMHPEQAKVKKLFIPYFEKLGYDASYNERYCYILVSWK